MKSLLCMLVLMLLVQIPVCAQPTEQPDPELEQQKLLNINEESMKNRNPTYSSVTDLFEIDIFTDKSRLREAAYAAYVNNEREQLVAGTFQVDNKSVLSPDERSNKKAASLGLFLNKDTTLKIIKKNTEQPESLAINIFGIIIILVAAGALGYTGAILLKKKKNGGDEI